MSSAAIIHLRVALVAFAAALCLVAPARAATPAAPDSRELVIATHEAPPFAIRRADGEWRGIAIDLWAQIAVQNGYRYRIVESDVPGMVDGVVDGRYDASVGALTITADREARVDFTQPFHATGFGIAVPDTDSPWFSLLRSFFTWGFLKVVLALCALLACTGVLFWLAERRHNPDQFAPGVAGIGSGFWFSAVTMTTVGYGDKAPHTRAGKMVALVWMFTGLVIISTFTGMIASSLTAGQLRGAVTGPGDLRDARVGSIAGSASDDWLSDERVGFHAYADVETGLQALRDGEIEAFVYDEPVLRYQVSTSRSGLRMLPGAFGRQDYGIALPQGSPLREAVNVTMLRIIESDAWDAQVRETLGEGR